MTLYDMGVEYEESAKPIRKRLAELRRELAAETDPEKRWHLKRRIAELAPMLTYCNRIARYCRRYYEKGFYIGNGALASEPKPARCGAVKQLAADGVALHLEGRTYSKSTDRD